VVIDTTVFQQDLTLSQSAWRQVRLWALKGRLQLWIPEVVVRESSRHYRSQVNQQVSRLVNAEDALLKLSWNRNPGATRDDHRTSAEQLKDGYEEWLRSLLTRIGATILPLPAISHDDLINRALREDKPFRIKGEGPKKGPDGYRDMLIWASVTEQATVSLDSRDTLIIVTGNHGDFCDEADPTTVAVVMRTDLGTPAPTVRRLAKLSELADILHPKPEEAAELQMQEDLAPGGRLRGALLEAIRQDCAAAIDIEIADPSWPDDYSTGLDLDEFRLPLETARLTSLDPELETADAVVYGTDPWLPDEILARVTVPADAYVTGYAHVSQVADLDDFSTSFVNDHMLEAERDFDAVLHFNARIDSGEVHVDLEKVTPAPETPM
jgi:hypothetical protein